MGEVKAAGNLKSVASSANLFYSPSDVRHEIDSLQDAISSWTTTEAENDDRYRRYKCGSNLY